MKTNENRPLSPHLQVYKPQLTSVLSILHRMTGVFLSIAGLLLAYWLVSLMRGPEVYADAMSLLGSGFMRLVLAGVSFSFFYHLCNGIRHLFWDAGYGFEIEQIYASGWTVVIASILLTVALWAVVLTGSAA
ncbi:MAG: succinate dehydrogenase, cytochrome b556 subunit [Gammaproteobacteria bacterium]|nr:succinate dehydrogenase, cytochrome b556 subunit [Gammaproteobacteria bacterium]